MTLDAILDELMTREGGFVDDPVDPGGATKYGITAGTLGNWRGWTRPATRAEVEALTRVEAKAIYIARYIEQPGFTPENIPDLKLRVALIDDGVNAGPTQAVKRLQRVVGALPDGVLGPKTIEVLKVHSPEWVRVQVVKARCVHYAEIVRSRPTQSRFIVGWISRALSFI